MIGGEPVVILERPAPPEADRPAFLGAQILPGRGMMTLQIRAHLPGRGETDLLAAPPLERAREILDGEEDFKGNNSYFFGAPILLPFANRIRGKLEPDGRTIEAAILGKTVRLPANAGGRKPGAERLAMHGLLLAAPFRQVDRETTDERDAVRGSFQAGDFEGHWLSATEVTCEIVLRSESFTLTVTARNVGDGLLPMGIGWHPYFALPSGRRTQARLHVPARRRLLVHDYDEVIPTGEVAPVARTPYDFSAPEGRALGDLFLDDCFVDLDRSAEGQVVAEILDPEAGYGVRVVTDAPHLRAIQSMPPRTSASSRLSPSSTGSIPSARNGDRRWTPAWRRSLRRSPRSTGCGWTSSDPDGTARPSSRQAPDDGRIAGIPPGHEDLGGSVVPKAEETGLKASQRKESAHQ